MLYKIANMQSSWESYRYFLQSVRSGTMKKAARVLGVDYTTVYRHIKNLEKSLGARLFAREGRETKPTSHGILLFEKLQRAENELFSAENLFLESRRELRGEIRISTSDTVGMFFLPEFMAQFQSSYPNIQVHISLDLNYVRLDKKEADIAISAGMGHPDHLIGYRLGSVEIGLYSHIDMDWSTSNVTNLKELRWITLDQKLAHLPSVQWVIEKVSRKNIYSRCSHFTLVHRLIREGLGVGFIPHYLGATDPLLRRIEPSPKVFSTDLWVVYHPDIKDVRRVSTFVDFLRKEMPPWLEKYSN